MAYIPRGATQVDRAEGILPARNADHGGKLGVVIAYEGWASRGYRSDYEQIPTSWLLMYVRDPATRKMTWSRSFSCTGRNFDQPRKQVEEFRQGLAEG